MEMRLLNLRERGLVVRAMVLVLAVVGLYLLVAPLAWYWSGSTGLVAATVAGICCLVGSGIALITGEPFRTPRRALYGMLLGMAFRMGVPLAVALVVYAQAGLLIRAGFVYYLLVFFEVALLVEVFLSLPPAQRGK